MSVLFRKDAYYNNQGLTPGISRASVSKAMSRGKKLIDKNQRLWDLLETS